MAQRSLHVVTKVYYRSISCFATVSQQTAPLAVLRFPTHSGPFYTIWFSKFTQNVTKSDHKDRSHPHSTEHDTLPIAYLISKQAVPYRTRGSTYWPGVSTPMTQSLADLSTTNHNPWRSQPSPPFQTLLKAEHRTSPRSPHITTDGSQHSQHSTQAKLNIIKMKTLVWWLKTAGLSNTTNHRNPIQKYEGLGNQLIHVVCVY
jgi:hypothetical protein